MGDTLSIKVYQALASALGDDPRPPGDPVGYGQLPLRPLHGRRAVPHAGQGLHAAHRGPEEVRRHRRNRRRHPADRGRLPHRPDARHGGADRPRPCGGRADGLGSGAFGGGAAGRSGGGGADFAVGCTYKYLNSGPGGPAFIYVAPRHADVARPALSGWLGHESPFAFDLDYRPGSGIERMRVGTPPVLQLAALEAALDIWDMATMADVRARSIELTEQFIAGSRPPAPPDACQPARPAWARQPGQLPPPEGYAIMQALIARGVIGDFRAPTSCASASPRFTPAPPT
jgi:kynureninase